MARKYTEVELKKNALIAANMKRFREEHGLSQPSASDYLGLSVDTIRKYEQAQRTPRTAELDRIAKMYGHTLDDFLNENPPPADPSLIPIEGIESMFMPKSAPFEVDPKLKAELAEFVRKKAAEQRSIWLRQSKKRKKKPS